MPVEAAAGTVAVGRCTAGDVARTFAAGRTGLTPGVRGCRVVLDSGFGFGFGFGLARWRTTAGGAEAAGGTSAFPADRGSDESPIGCWASSVVVIVIAVVRPTPSAATANHMSVRRVFMGLRLLPAWLRARKAAIRSRRQLRLSGGWRSSRRRPSGARARARSAGPGRYRSARRVPRAHAETARRPARPRRGRGPRPHPEPRSLRDETSG